MNATRGTPSPPRLGLSMRRRCHRWFAFCLPIAIAVAAYLGVLRCGFVWDDDDIVVNNVVIRNIRRALIPFGSAYWRTYHMSAGQIYRPIRTVSLAVDYAVWGLNPMGFHLTNVLLHALACWATYLMVLGLGGCWGVGFLAAVAFAVLPYHAESVVWVKNRADLLAYCFALGACVCVFRASEQKRKALALVAATVLYVLALLAKEVAVVTPLLAAITLACCSRRKRISALAYTAPLWVVCGIYLAMKFSAVAGAAATAGGLAPPPSLTERVQRTFAWYMLL